MSFTSAWLLIAAALPWSLHAPDVFRTEVTTTAGRFVIETHRSWAPIGADRFYSLVRTHYYDNSRFFRVVAGKWVQFGIAGTPAVAQAWRSRTVPDDPLLQHNLAGFVAFSNTAPGTRSTQVYINLRDNSAMNDAQAAFAPFGKVVSGMDVVSRLYAGYGEGSGGGMRAGHQDAMFEGGNAYLDANFPKLDKLVAARILPDP